jgi:hypothetical protein
MDQEPSFMDHWKRGVFILVMLSIVIGMTAAACVLVAGAGLLALDTIFRLVGLKEWGEGSLYIVTYLLMAALAPNLISQYADSEHFIPKLPGSH